MQVSGFPHCCGAAIFYGFQEYNEQFVVGQGEVISAKDFKKYVQRKMELAEFPNRRNNDGEWVIGRVSAVYAILTHRQPASRKVLEELGWQRLHDPVVNANTQNELQMYVYRIPAPPPRK